MAQSRPQPLPVTEDKPTKDQEAANKQALDAIASELRAIRDEAAKREQDQKAAELKIWGDTIPNWASLVVGTGGVIAAIVTLVLLGRQTASARRAADGAHRNAIAAVANARAAQDSARVASATLKATLRSQLVLKLVRFDVSSLQTDGSFVAHTRLHNTGRSTARITRGSIKTKAFRWNLSQSELPIIGKGDPTVQSALIVPPGDRRTAKHGRRIDLASVPSVMNGTYGIYFCLSVAYRDDTLAADEPDHRTIIGLRYNVATDSTEFLAAPGYNEHT
jgi:hypothetical protein